MLSAYICFKHELLELSLNILRETRKMTEETSGAQKTERVPIMQRVIDNPFLLLFIGVVFPTVFYVLWGIMELVTIPIAN